ncbi:hypothetical protein TorRG33x02_263270, partial [Trema orientale]
PFEPIFFPRHGTLFSRFETLSLVTSLELKPIKFLKFVINNIIGYVNCILWLNHLTSPYFTCQIPSDVRPIAASANCFTSEVLLVQEEQLSQGVDSNTIPIIIAEPPVVLRIKRRRCRIRLMGPRFGSSPLRATLLLVRLFFFFFVKETLLLLL